MQPLALQTAVRPKLLQLCVNCAPASCEFHSQLHRRCESRRAALSREATKSKEQRKEIVDLTAKLRALSLELASVKAASTRTRAHNGKLSKKAAAASHNPHTHVDGPDLARFRADFRFKLENGSF